MQVLTARGERCSQTTKSWTKSCSNIDSLKEMEPCLWIQVGLTSLLNTECATLHTIVTLAHDIAHLE